MNFYKYQRLRSFTDLCPGCLRFSTFNFSSKTAGLLETKLHLKPLGDVEIKVCALVLIHMTQDGHYAHIYDKNPLKISSQD